MIRASATINIASQSNARLVSATNMEVGGDTHDELYGDLSSVLNKQNAIPYKSVQICDENGVFGKPNLVTINGSELMSVNVAFSGGHPKNIYVSDLTETKTEALTLDGTRVGTSYNYSFSTIIDIGVPWISYKVVSRTATFAYPPTAVGNPSMTSSSIMRSGASGLDLLEYWHNAKSVEYVIEFEVLATENLKSIPVGSSIVEVGVGKPSDKILFLVNDWDTPNSPMSISGIWLDESGKIVYHIDSGNLSQISIHLNEREDLGKPSYGLISSGGDVEFIDHNGLMKQYIEEETLTNETTIDAYLLNTATYGAVSIGTMYLDAWSYDDDTFKVKLSLKDGLEGLQDVQFDGLPLSSQKSLYEIYEQLKGKTPSKFEFEDLDDKTKSFMEQIKVADPYIERGSLWSAFDKVAQIGALHIYKKNGKIITKHLF